MLWAARVTCRTRTLGVAVAVLLAATACTSGQAQSDPSTSALTPAGTAYPLPTASGPLPTAASVRPSPTSSSAAQSPPTVPTTAPTTTTSASRSTAAPSASTSVKSPPAATTTPRTTSSRPSTPISTPTLNTAGLSAAEIADRKAIESAWTSYWDLYIRINATPAKVRAAKLASLTVDPIKDQILRSATEFDEKGLGTFGSVSHRPYWGPSINGQKIAIMGDCINTSKYGSWIVKTKEVKSHGVERGNIRGVFSKGSDGLWRVQEIQILEGQAC